MDTLMGLPLGDNFFAAGKTGSTKSKADEFNLFYQQSFNKMLSSLTTEDSNNDPLGGSSNNSNDEFSFLNPQLPSAFNQEMSALSPEKKAAIVAQSGLGGNSLTGLNSSSDLMNNIQQLNVYSGMIGKTIEYRGASGLTKGVVKRVVVEAGAPYIELDNSKVTLQDIISIS